MTNHYNKLLLFIGTVLTSLILYNRLIRERIPKEFIDIYFVIKISIMILTLILLFVNIIIIYKYHFLHNKSKSKFEYIFEKISKHPYNPLKIAKDGMIELDIAIKNNTPYYDDHHNVSDIIFINIANIFFNKKSKIISIILFLRILPQMIVCICFLIDLLSNNKFFYFYKSLWLLIFPLIITYIVYSIKTLVETNLEELNNMLTLKIIWTKSITENTTLSDFISIDIFTWQQLLLTPNGLQYTCYNNLSESLQKAFKDDIDSAKYTLNFAVNFMNNLFSISYFIQSYDQYKLYIENSLNILKYTIFFIGWCYILIIA